MKQLLTIILLSFLVLYAEETLPDSTVTRVPLSSVKFYNIIGEEQNIEGSESLNAKYRDTASERPFAIRQPNDRWFSKDKWMHLSTSYFIVLQSKYVLNKNFRFAPEESNNISYGISLSLSLGKEFYDVFGENGIFSWKDLIYDLIGSGLGYLTVRAL